MSVGIFDGMTLSFLSAIGNVLHLLLMVLAKYGPG
jgi:hypothetical protein